MSVLPPHRALEGRADGPTEEGGEPGAQARSRRPQILPNRPTKLPTSAFSMQSRASPFPSEFCYRLLEQVAGGWTFLA